MNVRKMIFIQIGLFGELRLEEEYVKEEEICMSLDKKDALRIQEFEVNKKYGEGERR